MKAIIRKLKKANKPLKFIYFLSLILYTVGYVLITKSLIHLSGIETVLRIILIVFFGLWLITWLLVGLVSLFTRKYKSYVIVLIFTLIFTVIFGFATYYIDTIYNELSGFSKEKINYTSVLISMKDKELTSSSKIGIIDDPTDIEGYILAQKIIDENNLKNEKVPYNDYYAMLSDLYNNKIDAIFVSSNYKVLFSSEEAYQNIGDDVKVLYSHSEEMKNQDNIHYTNKKLTEPFTILVLGVDSEDDGLNANQAFNGDTMMMITFNPKTLTATVFSMPRDTYVPIACRNNTYAKINSSAASGVSCVTQTIEKMTSIKIDYFLKINFKGVVDLVNALDGITVNVEKPYFNTNNGTDYNGKVCEQDSNRDFGQIVCFDYGYQNLNGEEALAYSRNRHQYIGSDLDRIRHQQDVVEALAEKLKTVKTFTQFKTILNSIQKNIDTNMTTEQILSIYNVGKSLIVNSNSSISIVRTYLETYSLPVWTGSSTTSALGYYQSSLDEIIKIMKINLGLEKAVLQKTFSIDYNEDYESKSYGEGLRSNPQESTMPNLIGSTVEYATNWAKDNELTPLFEYVDNTSSHYNPSYGTGIIADQSIVIGTLLNDQKTITFYINKEAPKVIEDDEDDEVTFKVKLIDSDDNTLIGTREVKENSTVTLPTPTKKDYIFEGWYEDKNCTKEFDKTTKIDEDMSLYAKWKENKEKEEEEKPKQPVEDEEDDEEDDE